MPIKQVTISQIGATQTAVGHPLTHQLTVIDALMSHAQLTVSLRMVSQGQAAASQLLACQTSIRHAAAHPVLQSPVWWMTAANSNHHLQSHHPSVVPTLMKQELQ